MPIDLGDEVQPWHRLISTLFPEKATGSDFYKRIASDREISRAGSTMEAELVVSFDSLKAELLEDLFKFADLV